MSARINALRAKEGWGAFDPNVDEGDPVGAENLFDTASTGPKADIERNNARAELLKELEAAYSGVGGEVASNFRNAAQSAGQYNAGNEDYLRGMQSDVYSGTTGAQATMKNRIDALRSAQGLEPFSDASTSGQRYRNAAQATRGAMPSAVVGSATSATRDGADSEPVTEEGAPAVDSATTNAVTSAAKKKQTKVL